MFDSLDIIKTHDMTIGVYDIPIKIHIKDIPSKDTSFPLYYNNEVNIEGSDSILLTHKPSKYDRVRNDIAKIEVCKIYLKFIDTEIQLFNGKNFLEFYGLDCVEDLLEELSSYELQKLIDICDEIMRNIINEFYDNMFEFLDKKEDIPKIHLDDKSDSLFDEIVKYSSKGKGYLIAQIGIEFPANVFFQENVGKAISEWSFRELELQCAYMNEKNTIDGLMNKYQAKQHEDIDKKHKGGG
jgi:hypothetical protein